MFDKNNLKPLTNTLLPAVYSAGEVIMEVYNRGDITVSKKDNASPVTEADHLAEAVLLKGLAAAAPGVPVIAEELAEAVGVPKDGSREFFLVDPLDGTKEFINKRSAFTVNVALIQDGRPVFGIVYAPALGALYLGCGPDEAYKIETPGADWSKISVRKAGQPLTLVASKSHRNPETEAYLAKYPGAKTVSIGSSLKFCLVAEGEADLYPRFGPTMEWDTAAGHAVLAAAGGSVFTPEGAAFPYNKPGFKNGFFIARGDKAIDFVKN